MEHIDKYDEWKCGDKLYGDEIYPEMSPAYEEPDKEVEALDIEAEIADSYYNNVDDTKEVREMIMTREELESVYGYLTEQYKDTLESYDIDPEIDIVLGEYEIQNCALLTPQDLEVIKEDGVIEDIEDLLGEEDLEDLVAANIENRCQLRADNLKKNE